MTQQDVMTQQFRDSSLRIKHLRADKHSRQTYKNAFTRSILIKTEKLRPSVPKIR